MTVALRYLQKHQICARINADINPQERIIYQSQLHMGAKDFPVFASQSRIHWIDGETSFQRYTHGPALAVGGQLLKLGDNRLIKEIKGKRWYCCPHCGKSLFPVFRDTRISNMEFRCKACKHDLKVNIDGMEKSDT